MEKNPFKRAKNVTKPDKPVRPNNKLIVIKWKEETKIKWIKI